MTFLKEVTAKYCLQVLARRRFHHSYDEDTDETQYPDQNILDLLAGKKDEDDEYSYPEEKRQVAPAHLQEGLQQIVLRERSEHKRLEAIRKISSQDFLVEQAKSEKQRESVRKEATRFIKDPKVIDELALSGLDGTKQMAIRRTENKKVIDKLAEQGISEALEKTTNEDIIVKALKTKKDQNRQQAYYYGDVAKAMLSHLKSDKARAEVLPFLDARLKTDIAVSTKDKELLKNIVLETKTKKDDEYSYYSSSERYEAKQVALHKLNDPKLNKEVVFDPKQPEVVRRTAMLLLNDPKVYEKIALDDSIKNSSSHPHDFRVYAINKIDDEKLLKKIASQKGREDAPQKAALFKIKDQKFLTDYAKLQKDPDLKAAACKNIKDQDFLKTLYGFAKDSDEKRRILETVKDQKFLKDIYEFYNKKAELPATQDKLTYEQRRATKGTEHEYEQFRIAAVKNITDTDFLLNVSKRDGRMSVREAAFSAIKDPKILADRVFKEKSKTLTFQLIDKIKDQNVLVEIARHHRDPEAKTRAARKVTDPKVIKEIIKAHPEVATEYAHTFIPHLKGDQEYLKNLVLKSSSRPIVDAALGEIKDKDFILKFINSKSKFAKDHSVIQTVLDKITDVPTLEKIAMMEGADWMAAEAFSMIKGPSQEFLEKAVKTAPSATVREKALPFIKDEKLLKDLALNDAALAEKILPHFVDDKKFLAEVLLKSKSYKARANIFRRTKDEELLKQVASKDPSDLAVKALEKITDKEFLKVKGLALTAKNGEVLSASLKNIEDPEVLKAVVLRKDWREVTGEWKTKFENSVGACLEKLKAQNQLSTDFLTKLVKDVFSNPSSREARFSPYDLLDKYLNGDEHKDLIKMAVLIARDTEAGRKAMSKVKDDPEFAKKMYNEAANREVKLEALLKFKPEDLTPELIPDFINAMEITPEPHAVPVELVKRAYELGDEKQQEELKDKLPERHLNEKHKQEREKKKTPYLTPQTNYKDQKGEIKKLPQAVETEPQHQLLRLLVQLAK